MGELATFERLESEVRGYCRHFPRVFDRALGAELFTESGDRYLDFFAGAGVMNYGHNPPAIKEKLLEYLGRDGMVHSLDIATVAKRDFLEHLEKRLLKPRGLDYKVQFPGPTGTNAIEAALKLARKVTGRTKIVCFTDAFHGMTQGSLAVTGNWSKRRGAGVPLGHAMPMPFDGYLGPDVDTIDVLRRYLEDPSSGLEKPAAILVEPIQAEGGVNVASAEWLRRLQELAHEQDILFIADEIQVGCGRTGPFFSFEEAGVKPDMVLLSKSLSGFGLPLAVVLMRPDIDQWSPGEHNGTFRGHDPAFVTAVATLETYWADDAFQKQVTARGERLRSKVEELAEEHRDVGTRVRGRGLILGLEFDDHGLAGRISEEAFSRGLVIETAGAHGQVVKFLPPLILTEEQIDEGVGILREAIPAAIAAGR